MGEKEAKEIINAGFAWADWTDSQKEALRVVYESLIKVEELQKEIKYLKIENNGLKDNVAIANDGWCEERERRMKAEKNLRCLLKPIYVTIEGGKQDEIAKDLKHYITLCHDLEQKLECERWMVEACERDVEYLQKQNEFLTGLIEKLEGGL